MTFVALRMLTGDRAKYFGLVFAIAFCTFLLENQMSIFANIMKRTAHKPATSCSFPANPTSWTAPSR